MNSNNQPENYNHFPATVETQLPAVIQYGMVDGKNIYSFDFSDDVHADYEDATGKSYDDHVYAEFDDCVSDDEKQYYLFAISSGFLTGAISSIGLPFDKLQFLNDGRESLKIFQNIIVDCAGSMGFKGKGFNNAIAYIVNTFGAKAGLNVLGGSLLFHPSVLGLVFNLVAQYSGKMCSLSNDGELLVYNCTNDYVIGNTDAEKMLLAALYWLFELALFKTKGFIADNDTMLKKYHLYELIDLFSKWVNIQIPKSDKDIRRMFNNLLRKYVKNSPLCEKIGIMSNESLRFLKESIRAVCLNEALMTSFYVIRKMVLYGGSGLGGILDPNDPVLIHMKTIGSATFVIANVGVVIIGKANGSLLRAKVNIVGIGRFFFAIFEEYKYWNIHVHAQWQRRADGVDDLNFSFSDMNSFYLEPEQMRLLLSLKYEAAKYDVSKTRDSKQKEQKKKWLDENRSIANLWRFLGWRTYFWCQAHLKLLCNDSLAFHCILNQQLVSFL